MVKYIFMLTLFILSLSANSQSESLVKDIFEGSRVEVLVEMPASSEGIDLHVDKAKKMNYEQYSERLKKYGIALYPGEIVMITKIKKKGKHIEFQLAGGGYGTWGDEDGNVSARRIQKSSREKKVEEILKEDKDKKLPNRKELESELSDLKRERSIDQNESDRQAALESEMKKSRIQEQRLQGGSRFNIRYDYKISSAELTEASIKEALADYINFRPGSTTSNNSDIGSNSNSASGLSKGISMKESMRLLGIPSSLDTRNECGLTITTCIFETEDQKIDAIFVEKVLVKYSVSSR